MTVADAEKRLRFAVDPVTCECTLRMECHRCKLITERINDLKAAVVNAVLGGQRI